MTGHTKGSNKKTPKKTHTSSSINQWIDKLAQVVDKTIAAMPGFTKKVTEEAGKMSEQLQKNPVFKDVKKKLVETGKQAGDKLGIASPAATPPKKKKASQASKPAATKTSKKAPVKKTQSTAKKKASSTGNKAKSTTNNGTKSK